jgi:hypothetical protein
MNIYEQLTQISKQLENVRETLTHSNEMEAFEVKEYKAVEAGYVAKIAELKAFITEDAETLGTEAFEAGISCAPALDKEVMKAVATLSTPDFTHSKVIVAVFKAWNNGWHTANINSVVVS